MSRLVPYEISSCQKNTKISLPFGFGLIGLSIFCLLFLLIPTVSAQPVSIVYFHQKGCHDCEITDPLVDRIETQYNNGIIITRIETNTADGFNQWNKYGFLEVPAIVINNETKIRKEEITEEKLKTLIDEHLVEEENITEYTTEGTTRKEQEIEYINTNLNLPFAYSLGLFAGFSPCLMAILGFLLSFTAGTSSSTKNGMVRAIIFGLGLVSSYIVLGLCLLSFRKSIPSLDGFSFITGIIVILIGLNLLGILKSPVVLDNYFQNSARKYAGTLGGVFFLGVLFSFVKVPCTAPMLLVLLNKTITSGTVNDLTLLLAFSAGVLTPFIGIGLIGGYTLSKQIRSYKIYLKKISGFVLILLGLWIMF
ncbi:cytochrome c biogenesis protein CcdA [Methanosarcina sp. Z-7115]|uniref:Cytochrome c biogenesis protein CcdA n=1 Tax=Methanosarcina baikalica TaxID=3073890 RepID=A0ABU2D5N6_9EURY|nr:cytochrome c biogenesis protein CcdA [Methanosarcina sp. Z-7115]MDR7667293.1 cytochrome c biogenesis protein CcdA [Methanosarcina sp. Z-7115]